MNGPLPKTNSTPVGAGWEQGTRGAAASCEHDAKKKLEDLPIGQVEDVVHRFWIVADAGVPVVDNLTRSLLLHLREVVVACRDFKVSG